MAFRNQTWLDSLFTQVAVEERFDVIPLQLLPNEVITKIFIDCQEELKASILSKHIHECVRYLIVQKILNKSPLKSEVRLVSCGHPENTLSNIFLECFQERKQVGYVTTAS